MNINQYFNLMARKRQTIAIIMSIFLSVAILASAVQPFKYGSSLKLLTINTFNETDPYTVSRSNEHLSNLLSQIVSSNSFFGKVKDSSSNIDASYFNGDSKKQMKKWNKTAKAKGLGDTGMISIDVYHTDPSQATEIARAVAYVLQTDHGQYHGFGDKVQIKMIDEPITSSFPVQPNVLMNLSLAIIFGLLFSLGYIYLFPEERYDLGFSRKRSIPSVKKEAVESLKDDDHSVVAESVYPEVYQNREYAQNYNLAMAEVEDDFEARGDMSNILSK
jgi:capsular polysaccharide biosynthesis protein